MRKLLLSLFLVASNFYCNSQSITSLTPLQSILLFAEVSEANGVAIVGGLEAYKSVDNGFTWTEFNDNFGTSLYAYETYAGTIISSSTYCMLGRNVFDNTYAVLRTIDGGINWSEHLISTSSPNPKYTDIDFNGTSIVVTAENGIYRSLTNGATWTFHTISSNQEISPFIQHNTSTGDWISGKYATDFSISSNNGLTWSQQSIPPYFSTGILDASNQNTGFLLTDSIALQSRFLSVDASYNVVNSVLIDNQYFYAGLHAQHAFYLPNGNIFTHNGARFHSVDVTNSYVYYYDHEMINNLSQVTGPNDVDIDQTYGIAVGNWGAISRIDLAQPADLFVPADFTIQSTLSCPGDILIASADNPFADSVQWFYGGNYISSDSLLSYTTPSNYGTFAVEMRSWKDGNFISSTSNITFNSPLIPHPFSAFVDTTQCYGNSAQISLYSLPSSNSSTYIEAWVGNNNFYPPQLLGTSNYTISTPALLTGDDTLRIITVRPQQCDTTTDTLLIILTIDTNPYLYTILEPDSVQCQGSSYSYQLTNTNNLNDYTINQSYSVIGSTSSQSAQGNSSSTLSLDFTAPTINNNMGLVYQQNFFGYYELEINGSYGCVYSNFYYDTIRIQRSTALIYPGSASFYNSDTIQVFNPLPYENRTWSIDNFPAGDISNVNDTVPIISTDTTGFFDLELVNEPIPGCVDSTKKYIHICEPNPIDTTDICDANVISSDRRINQIKIDQFGNTYFSGTKSNFQGTSYFFVKYNSDGIFQWRIDAGSPPNMSSASSLEGFDFDENGDVYVGVWVQSNTNYSTPYGALYTSSSEGRQYLSKVNKDNGIPYWTSDITQFPSFYPGSGSIRQRISDVEVDNNKIYFGISQSSSQGMSFRVAAATLDGNYIGGSSSILIDKFMMGGNLEKNFLIYTGSCGNSRQSFFSPQLEVLSNGVVVGLVEFRPSSVVPPATITELITDADKASFAFKYTVGNGIYDITLVGEHGEMSSCISTSIPSLRIDDNDNITFAFNYSNGPNQDIVSVVDSTIDLRGGSVVYQTDSDFNLNWCANSPNHLFEIASARTSGQTFVSMTGNRNVSMGIDTTNLMFGDYEGYASEYGTNAYDWEARLLNSSYKGLYVWTLSQEGIPERISPMEEASIYQTGLASPHPVATPCGNVRVFLNSSIPNTSNVFINAGGSNYTLDECLEIRFSDTCATANCQFLGLPDSLSYCESETQFEIPILDIYNVDSVYYELTTVPGGNTFDSGWYPIDSTVITLPFPTGLPSDFWVSISSPYSDSVYINVQNGPVLSYALSDTLCSPDDQLVTISPFNVYNVLLNGSINDFGDVFTYTSNDYVIGNNVISVQSNGSNGCILSDTAMFFVHPEVNLIPDQTSYLVGCFDSLVIGYNDTSFVNSQWTLNGSPSSNFFDASNLQFGINTVLMEATDANGCNDSTEIEISFCYDVSINEIEANSIRLYPNPSNGTFKVEFSDPIKSVQLSLTDAQGKLVSSQSFSNSTEILISEELSPGFYFLELNLDGMNHHSVIIIE